MRHNFREKAPSWWRGEMQVAAIYCVSPYHVRGMPGPGNDFPPRPVSSLLARVYGMGSQVGHFRSRAGGWGPRSHPAGTFVPKLQALVYDILPSRCRKAMLGVCFVPTLRTSLSGTLLQTLPDLVTLLKGYSLSPRSCPATRSAPSERVLIWL